MDCRVVVLFLLHVPALILLRKMVYCGKASVFRSNVARALLDFVLIVIPIIFLATVLSGIHHITLPVLLLCNAALYVQRSNCVWHMMASQLTYNAAPRASNLQYLPHGTLTLQILWNQLCDDVSDSEHLLLPAGDTPGTEDMLPPGSSGNTLPNLRSAMVSVFKGGNMVLTCVSILAVDFVVYPRHFVKTEDFGCSLMDVGVGSFIVGSAITSHFSRGVGEGSSGGSGNGSTVFPTGMHSLTFHAFQRLLILLLGVGRFVCLRALNYQVHVSEYGLHWNFFVTLFAVWTATDICDWVLGRLARAVVRRLDGAPGALKLVTAALHVCSAYYKWFLCAAVVFFYQVLLLVPWKGGGEGGTLTEYLLDDSSPRDSLLRANKEGFFSVLGYLGLYWAAELLAREVIYAPLALYSLTPRPQKTTDPTEGPPVGSASAPFSVSVLGVAVDDDDRPPVAAKDSVLERRTRSSIRPGTGIASAAGTSTTGSSVTSGTESAPTPSKGEIATSSVLHEVVMHVGLEDGSTGRRKPTVAVKSVSITAAEVYHATSRQMVTRLMVLSVLSAAAYTWVGAEVQGPSRRLCNAAYLLYVLFISTINLLLCHLVDNVVVVDFSLCSVTAITEALSSYNPNGPNSPLASPTRSAGAVAVSQSHAHSVYHRAVLKDILANNKISLFEFINRHQLCCFMIANVLTGTVNQSVQTIYCSSETAIAILVGYMGIITIAMCVLNRGR